MTSGQEQSRIAGEFIHVDIANSIDNTDNSEHNDG